MIKVVSMLLCFFFSLNVSAQFKSATVGIDGLTCSMCSFGVQKSIEKLKFIQKVKVDLNSNLAYIEFKDGAMVDMNEVIKSIYDAGFSVRNLTALFSFNESTTPTSPFFQFEHYTYIVLEQRTGKIQTNTVEVQFVDKKFSDTKEYKKHKSTIDKASQNLLEQLHYFVVII
jgi:copper chaperone CopZ